MQFDLAGLRRAVAGIGDQRAGLRSQIVALQAERDLVAGAPPTRLELKGTYVEFLRRMSLNYERSMAAKLEPLLRKPGMLEDSARVNPLLSVFLGATRPDEMPSVGAMDQALAFVLGAQLEKAMCALIDGLEFIEGLPADKRVKRLRALDDQIEQLLAQESELIEHARQAGVNLEA